MLLLPFKIVNRLLSIQNINKLTINRATYNFKQRNHIFILLLQEEIEEEVCLCTFTKKKSKYVVISYYYFTILVNFTSYKTIIVTNFTAQRSYIIIVNVKPSSGSSQSLQGRRLA